MNDRAPAFFRIQAALEDQVNVEVLGAAMEAIRPRFPLFHVELRRGAFWFYFERNLRPHGPIADSIYPMQKPEAGKPGAHLYRVRAFQNRLALEMSHVVTDGSGGLTLFMTLLAEYYRLMGADIPCGGYILDPRSPPETEEMEDSFARYSCPGMPSPPAQKPAWHVPGGLLPKGQLRIITGRLSTSRALALAKEHKASLGEFLTAVYFSALQDLQDAESGEHERYSRKAIRIEVPADMRKLFPSKTLRNFSLFLEPSLDTRLQHYSFQDILAVTKAHMALGLQKGELLRVLTRNVEAARSVLIRLLPLPVKNVFMRALSAIFGDRMFSGVLSNLGPLRMPEELASRIRTVDLFVNTSPVIKQAMAVVSHKDVLSINFSSLCEHTDVERAFFRKLVRMGLRVKLESNWIGGE